MTKTLDIIGAIDGDPVRSHDGVTEWADCTVCGRHLDGAADDAPKNWTGGCWHCGAPAALVGLRITRRVTYVVQFNESADPDTSEWIDCQREDLIERSPYNGDTRNLPIARFRTRSGAEKFIWTLRGMMHCGGEGTTFRVVERA